MVEMAVCVEDEFGQFANALHHVSCSSIEKVGSYRSIPGFPIQLHARLNVYQVDQASPAQAADQDSNANLI